MEAPLEIQLLGAAEPASANGAVALPNAGASPFKIVVDPHMRTQIKAALIRLIDHHDDELAAHFADGKLALESYKEYVELFARSLKETMESREGVAFLLRSAGFDIDLQSINLEPQWRWKTRPSSTATPAV